MRNVFVGAALIGVAVYAVRRMGPALGEQAMRECETMFESMPEDFPPKRMMRGIDEIREQNARIVGQLEKLENEVYSAAANDSCLSTHGG